MLTLYHAPRSRSFRILWLLEELGVPYDTEMVSIRRGDDGHRPPADYIDIHPHGKVPALVHDGVPVFETPAIALYLTDLFPQAGLGPVVGDRQRGPYLTWLSYSTGVLEPALVERAFKLPHAGSAALGWASADEVEEVLTRVLESRPFFLGDKFSAVDIVLGGSMQHLMRVKLMPETSVFNAYVERLAQRPAMHRALQRDGDIGESGAT
ncbi:MULTISPECIES: glutathione S-transferase family protein [unclassified Achromobacter]|uniref:glutathione S-transferase family protein n=1 Tax=unclassified Achromobacter TaxID=2626865 RepID=UPI00069E6905|nr:MULTISPECIES: glutathione S-transferase family protein [unclassified Achromobacter]KOF52763.1 glutathione S-transferase [Achromobacter sp. DMS1]